MCGGGEKTSGARSVERFSLVSALIPEEALLMDFV